jgi:hypothetical protein
MIPANEETVMTSHLLVAVIAAFLSSGLTLLCAILILQKRVIPQALAEVETDLLPKFRDEVANGAMDAGAELLPLFRENVRLGFQDAMRDGVGGNLMEGAAKTVAKSMEMGISGFLKK